MLCHINVIEVLEGLSFSHATLRQITLLCATCHFSKLLKKVVSIAKLVCYRGDSNLGPSFKGKKKKKKATKDKKTLQMMHLNLQHPQEKDSEKGSHFLSLNFFS